ncbi:hypothetical protein A5759_02760 [Mycobacterium sp. 852014-52144_SCH5372336]|nr:hypothetical protein A5759_02760 [Mycobacterium sp. 852014-52144_SCH5372336]
MTVITALTTAPRDITVAVKRAYARPANRVSVRLTQAVTPDASRPSLTTKSDAMNTITASPNPLNSVLVSTSPVKYSSNATPIATTSTGSRFQMNNTTATPTITKLSVASDILWTFDRFTCACCTAFRGGLTHAVVDYRGDDHDSAVVSRRRPSKGDRSRTP